MVLRITLLLLFCFSIFTDALAQAEDTTWNFDYSDEDFIAANRDNPAYKIVSVTRVDSYTMDHPTDTDTSVIEFVIPVSQKLDYNVLSSAGFLPFFGYPLTADSLRGRKIIFNEWKPRDNTDSWKYQRDDYLIYDDSGRIAKNCMGVCIVCSNQYSENHFYFRGMELNTIVATYPKMKIIDLQYNAKGEICSIIEYINDKKRHRFDGSGRLKLDSLGDWKNTSRITERTTISFPSEH